MFVTWEDGKANCNGHLGDAAYEVVRHTLLIRLVL